jgi:hypothetical protein
MIKLIIQIEEVDGLMNAQVSGDLSEYTVRESQMSNLIVAHLRPLLDPHNKGITRVEGPGAIVGSIITAECARRGIKPIDPSKPT